MAVRTALTCLFHFSQSLFISFCNICQNWPVNADIFDHPPHSFHLDIQNSQPLPPQRTLDEDCRQAEEPKQLVDEASRFHLGRQHQHSAVICSGALIFSSRVLRPSPVTLCSHKSGRCAVEFYHASHLWYPPFYTSPMASSSLQH